MGTTIASDGIHLHHEVFGRSSGEPVLLIQGLGADSGGWAFQRLALAPHYRTIVFDNRGVGRSDKPLGAYSIEQMALDAVRVLDAAGVESAHVVGASMGGAIAQVVAVLHPERVRSLTLACTACRNHPWRRELLSEWAVVAEERGMGELSRTAMRWLIGPRSLRRFSPLLGAFGPLAMAIPPHAFVGQVGAILEAGDAEGIRELLTTISVPTLVMVGSQDILTPLGDSEELVESIPGAELVVVTGAAHGFMVEHATTFNRELLAFLSRARHRRALDAPDACAS